MTYGLHLSFDTFIRGSYNPTRPLEKVQIRSTKMAVAPIEAPPRVVRFGLFEVDLAGDELRRNGLRLKLQDQQLQLLKILLEHHGTLVSREELRRRLWNPEIFVEFDHSLNTAMMRLREALGDSSDNPRFIQTVPRKGYIFIAPVHFIREDPPEAPAVTPPAVSAPSPAGDSSLVPLATHAPPKRREISLVYALAGAFAAVLLALGSIAGLQRLKAPPAISSAKPITSIAVLPMQNLSGDSNQDYFADGMTDELIASLAKISSLRVISRTTAMEYKGKHQSLEKIAQDLNVDAVVEGTVLRSGNRVRITAELVQVSTDRHLWADTYESPLGDILTLQNQVASAIVGQIRIKLTPQDQQRLAAAHRVNSDAYEDYLKGRYYWSKRSEQSLVRAIHYYQSAIDKDPQYALAYAGLADCYGILGAAIVGTVPTRDVAQKATDAATTAVRLEPDLVETQTALATVEFNYNWDWQAAGRDFQRAIELNPGYATAHQRYSLYLAAMGQSQASLNEMNRARSLDPLSLSINFSLGWRLYMARQYEQANAQLLNTIEMDPSYVLSYIILGQSYEQQKRYPEAIAQLQKAATLSPDSPPVLSALGHVYAQSGRRAEAIKLLERLKQEASERYVSPYYMALLYSGLGDRERTLSALQEALDDRSNNMIFLNVLPQFDALRGDPRFQSLLHQVADGGQRAGRS